VELAWAKLLGVALLLGASKIPLRKQRCRIHFGGILMANSLHHVEHQAVFARDCESRMKPRLTCLRRGGTSQSISHAAALSHRLAADELPGRLSNRREGGTNDY
jgi:hypothetical protein